MGQKYKRVFFISIDNLRADCIAANPDKDLLKKYKLKNRLNTPVLDFFVSKGVLFNNCITVAPYTTAAHASILTGQWPYRHGIIDFFRNKLKSPTILSFLNAKGYKTLFQADYPFILGPNLGFDKGIDKFVEENEKESFSWLDKNREKPIAAFFHFANVHDPYGYFNLRWGGNEYKEKVKKLLKIYDIFPDKKFYKDQHFITTDFSEEEYVLKQNYKKILNVMHERGLYGEIMDLYVEGVNYFEKNRFKPFVDGLRSRGLLNDALIIIFGDHGEAWDKDNQGHNRGNLKNGLIDDMIKVPVIFCGHDVPQSVLVGKQIRTIDIVPTALSYMGYPGEMTNIDGVELSSISQIPSDLVSYSQIWKSETGKLTKYMQFIKNNETGRDIEYRSYLASAAVKLGQWKLVENYLENGSVEKSVFMRNNTELDVDEEKDTAAGLSKKLSLYNKKVQTVYSKSLSNDQSKNKEEIAEQLRELGYKV